MRITVNRIAPDRAEVTIAPNWLERIFGARLRRGVAVRGLDEHDRRAWWWEATDDFVGWAVQDEIACPAIAEPPAARVVSP